MVDFVPTQEQNDCVEAVKMHPKLKIEARAGSGKSSTLVLISEDNPVRSLYVTFNKNMAVEAANKFPPHVEVRTTHSLAYAVTGVQIAHKLMRPRGAYQNVCGTGAEIARFFKIAPFVVSKEKSISGTAMGYAVKSTVTRFEHSGDREMTDSHVSFYEALKVINDPYFAHNEYSTRVLKYAQKLWKERINPRSPIQATHDTYLKMYQLSNPDLSRFDMIYLDEGHDSNGCLLDIIFSQKKVNTVMVGDTYQSIYQWRGAINAMETTPWPTAYLTKSFRFGQAVADVAQTVLLDEDGKKHLKIEGFENINSSVQTTHNEKQYTWLFRTNAMLISTAVSLIEQGRKVNLNVDIGDFKSLLNSAIALRLGKTKDVKHHDLVSFDNWQEFKDDLEISNRLELKRIFKYVEDGEANYIIDVLDNYSPCTNPDIILTTAHKAKGLEWDVVVIADDFPEFKIGDDGEWVGWSDQDRNLLYVAVTRAKKILVVNELLSDLFKWYSYDNVSEVVVDKEVEVAL